MKKMNNVEEKSNKKCGTTSKTNSLDIQIGGDHYSGKIQPIEFIIANNIPFIEGTIIKYLFRWKKKNGLEDLYKAQHYLNILIEANKHE